MITQTMNLKRFCRPQKRLKAASFHLNLSIVKKIAYYKSWLSTQEPLLFLVVQRLLKSQQWILICSLLYFAASLWQLKDTIISCPETGKFLFSWTRKNLAFQVIKSRVFHTLFTIFDPILGADQMPSFWGHVVRIAPVPKDPKEETRDPKESYMPDVPRNIFTFSEWLRQFGRL